MVQKMIQYCIFLPGICSAIVQLNAQRTSTLIMSASVREGLGRRPGLDFAVRIIESGEILDLKPLNYLYSKHSVITGLPEGDYQVIFIGSLVSYPIADTVVQHFFDTIHVESGTHYYHGYMNSRVIFEAGKLRIQVCQGGVDKLERKLRTKSILGEGENLVKLAPYREENLVLEL